MDRPRPQRPGDFSGEDRGENDFRVFRWDHWYDYPGSHWREENIAGLDVGEKSPQVYALHVLVGHHGILSLTPMWLLALVGGAMALISGKYRLRALVLGIAALTAVCLAFYLTRDINDRNYGGATSCFRWMLWFAPLWLLCMLPLVDWLAKSRIGRSVAILLLIASVASATVTMMNPWVHRGSTTTCKRWGGRYDPARLNYASIS